MKLLPAVGAAFLVWFLVTKKSAESLSYYFKGFSLSFDGITPVLKITIAIQNITNRNFNITGFTGNLFAGDVFIGNVSNIDPVVVEKGKETLYVLNVRLSLVSLVSDIISKIVQKEGLDYSLYLVGTLNAEGVLIPVNFNFTV